MDISVKGATQTQPLAQTKPVAQSTSAKQKSTQETPQPAPADTVQVSSAAVALLQETMETSAQTTKEAMTGDRQAQRLLAKEAATNEAVTKQADAKQATAKAAEVNLYA